MKKAIATFFSLGVISIVVLTALGYYYCWDWVGVSNYTPPKTNQVQECQRTKTLWDWMELLIVPVTLSGGAWLISERQKASDEKQANERRKQVDYESYLSRISKILDKYPNARTLEESGFDKSTIRAWTLVVLRRLDPARKGDIIQYLYETDLISTDYCLVDLQEADLSGADLENRFLPGIDLSRSILTGANLKGVVLGGEFLIEGAEPSEPLSKGKLNSSNLAGVDLTEADLTGARLGGVNLKKVVWKQAVLKGANLKGAQVDDVQALKKEAKVDCKTVFP
ncbi:MAG: pentapeptide repeat-containing protein [Cyanobacteria bacterium P01_D01_bin.156]